MTFFAPGMVVLSMLFTGLQSGTATMTDIDTGMLAKLLTSPIRRPAILAGRVIADAAVMLVQGVPGWLQGAMKANPAAYVITTGQQPMNAGNNWGQDLRTLAAPAISGLILIPAAITTFRTATH